MIIIELQGGLGNQMFQYAAGKSLATERNTNVLIDKRWYENTDQNGESDVRKYELNIFKLKQDFYSHDKRSARWRIFNRRTEFDDQDSPYEYHKDFFLLPRESTIRGYYQNAQYFIKHQSIIRKDFEWKNALSKTDNEVYKKIKSAKCSIAVHVRRGDYAKSKINKDYFGLLDMGYYSKAIQIMKSKYNNPTFFIFSNDSAWCDKQFGMLPEAFVVKYDGETNSSESGLRLMSLCDNHIIANSSYSWWSAWLSKNNNKVVIAPKNWVKSNKVESSNVALREWLRV